MSFTGAVPEHAHTETAAGHATLSTGVHPSRHGIVANAWDEPEGDGWRSVYAVEDPEGTIVGLESWDGRSPENLLRTGLADWIVEADPEARVVSVSTKDRAAITMASKARGHVYWIAPSEGRFVTSAFYRDAYPAWVEDFNRDVMPGIYADSVWHSRLSPTQAARTRRDTFPAEGDGIHTAFPHRAAEEVQFMTAASFRNWVRGTPALDRATLGLALTAVDELELGMRAPSTDLLALSFSQTDYVGHGYGPMSREQLDNLLRLDAVLGELMEGLDARVGEGRWVLALTGDHGVVDIPEWRVEQGRDGLRLSRDQIDAMVANVETIVEETPEAGEREERLLEYLHGLPFVAAAYTHRQLLAGEPADSFAVLYRNSYVEGRYRWPTGRYGVEVRATEGTLDMGYSRGTGHGTPYWYDRHVPLVFLGAGIEPGVSSEPVATVDVAPSLARLGGIPVPGDLDGRALIP
jgi:hypothetical protein